MWTVWQHNYTGMGGKVWKKFPQQQSHLFWRIGRWAHYVIRPISGSERQSGYSPPQQTTNHFPTQLRIHAYILHTYTQHGPHWQRKSLGCFRLRLILLMALLHYFLWVSYITIIHMTSHLLCICLFLYFGRHTWFRLNIRILFGCFLRHLLFLSVSFSWNGKS
jgi:hypothetical protein